ncbi:MAG: RES family NAD+ phosphorylase [Deinococcota bacterium]|nr:RES family NAD+ phosphorylase [Deinococcota bacterium]
MITAWRLTRDLYHDQAMTGSGGLFAPGRWHTQGKRIIYSSSSLALATLELFVNLQNKNQLARYVKTRILIPEPLVTALADEGLETFVRDPEGFDSRAYGDLWLEGQRSCVLAVPSRVVMEETNYLINPLHPAFAEITATTEPYRVDERLLSRSHQIDGHQVQDAAAARPAAA